MRLLGPSESRNEVGLKPVSSRNTPENSLLLLKGFSPQIPSLDSPMPFGANDRIGLLLNAWTKNGRPGGKKGLSGAPWVRSATPTSTSP